MRHERVRITSEVPKKLECESDNMSDLSESLVNSSDISVIDEDDRSSELTRLKADLERKNWFLHYELKDFKHFKKLTINQLEKERSNLKKRIRPNFMDF